jgi:pimeloyl-ACP methyl ester carboxylesterase
MMNIRDLGMLAAAVYKEGGTYNVPGIQLKNGTPLSAADHVDAVGSYWDAFQAAAYAYKGRLAVAFRGTTGVGDGMTDLALGLGMNSEYYEQAEAFVRKQNGRNIVLVGHSLGGAIAQVVGNRLELPIVTFNAPGVGVISSRHLATADLRMMKLRLAGMAASAVLKPGQAIKDIKSAFNVVRGYNICLMADAVSRIGLHYGRVERIPGTSLNPYTEHLMATMNEVLQNKDGKYPRGQQVGDLAAP